MTSVPDGGWGWMVVLAGFFCNFLNAGFVQTLGVYLVEWQDHFGVGAGALAAISSEFSCISHLVGIPAGALCSRYGCRRVELLSGFIATLATFLGAFATKLWHLHLFAIFTGIGYGMAFPPPIAIISLYFKKRLGLANGLLYTGIGVGILAMGPLLAVLCKTYGWEGALLVHSALTANTLVCGALFRPSKLEKQLLLRTLQSKSRRKKLVKHDRNDSKVDSDRPRSQRRCLCLSSFVNVSRTFGLKELLRNIHFDIYLLSTFLVFTGQAACVMFIPSKLVCDLNVSNIRASFGLTVMGICITVSSLLHGPLLDCGSISSITLFIFSVGAMGTSALISPLAKSYAGQLVLVALFGTGQGIVFPMFNLVCLEFVRISQLPLAIGMVVGLGGFGALIGIQLMGLLYDKTGSYDLPFILAGCVQWLGVLILILLTRCFRWERPREKAPNQNGGTSEGANTPRPSDYTDKLYDYVPSVELIPTQS
ncbi:monocarboxylate transporter 13-like [Diadema antillarum]|uniref:monocarboxylate transporter 13-like n=1 Tax=Diadema antillarum TaxID=105358 RepID=UPI003A8A63B5